MGVGITQETMVRCYLQNWANSDGRQAKNTMQLQIGKAVLPQTDCSATWTEPLQTSSLSKYIKAESFHYLCKQNNFHCQIFTHFQGERQDVARMLQHIQN
jgi:hypothetical protein